MSLAAKLGITLAKEMDLAAGRLWMEYAPIGHGLRPAVLAPASTRRRPAAREWKVSRRVASWIATLRARGWTREVRRRPLIAVADYALLRIRARWWIVALDDVWREGRDKMTILGCLAFSAAVHPDRSLTPLGKQGDEPHACCFVLEQTTSNEKLSPTQSYSVREASLHLRLCSEKCLWSSVVSPIACC